MMNSKSIKTASEISSSDRSFPRTHILKVPNRALIKLAWATVAAFFACLLIMDIPGTDRSFPSHIIELARYLLIALLILMLLLMVVFAFHRKKIAVTLNDKGINMSDEGFLPWQEIQWFRIDVFSANGIRKIVLKIKERKVSIIADDGVVFGELEEEIREMIGIYNPLAKDYNTLNVSRNWGYFYIALLTVIHIVIGYLTDFEVNYMVIFTPILLFIIMLIYVEKMRRTGKG